MSRSCSEIKGTTAGMESCWKRACSNGILGRGIVWRGVRHPRSRRREQAGPSEGQRRHGGGGWPLQACKRKLRSIDRH